MHQKIEDITSLCWECDAETDQPVHVIIRAQANFEVGLLLCLHCYHACCVPLASPTTVLEPVAATLFLTSTPNEPVPVH